MIEFRSAFDRIFGGARRISDDGLQQARLINTSISTFAPYNAAIYDDLTARTCIDVIARHAAKARPRHVRKKNQRITPADTQLDALLENRPNYYMSTYDFLYKVISQLFSCNNALVYVQKDNQGNVQALYPLDYQSLQLKEDGANNLYCQFSFGGMAAKRITVPYEDLIHIRRHYNQNDLWGSGTHEILQPTLSLLDTCRQGIENAIKTSTKLIGYLGFTQNLRPDDLLEKVKKFAKMFRSTSAETGGIAGIDNTAAFHQLQMDSKTAENDQTGSLRTDVYRYFGVNAKILDGSYSEDEWQAFYEGVLEPLFIQLSQEFTAKLFTVREQVFGNAIVFDSNRLQYSSLKNKVEMAEKLIPVGVLTINQALEILNLPQIDDEVGEKRFMTLNNVSTDIQDEYQGGKRRVIELTKKTKKGGDKNEDEKGNN